MEKMLANSSRRSIVRVCVDGFENYDFFGRVESPLLGSVPFQGVLNLISLLENFYNEMKFPQSTFQLRSFTEQPVRRRKKKNVSRANAISYSVRKNAQGYVETQGAIATFSIHVMFRQNATWQGQISWLDLGRCCKFHSTLELLTLMEAALSHTKGLSAPSTWQQANIAADS